MRLLGCVIFISTLLVPDAAWATDPPGTSKVKSTEVAPDTENGKPKATLLRMREHSGMWFPMGSAKRILKTVKEHPIKMKELAKTQDLLQLRDARIGLLEKNNSTNEQIAEIWRTTAQDQAKALGQRDPWWRSPYLWTAVGFAVGAAVTVGIAVAVKKSGAVE
jgi:hypothetical protein